VREIVEAGVADGSFAVPDVEGVTLAIVSLCVDVCRWFADERDDTGRRIGGTLYSELAVRLVSATSE
jgi:hypothetical protein